MTKLPESLDGLSIADLNDLLTSVLAEQKELAALSDDDLNDDKLTELEAAGAAAVSLREQIASVEAAEAARAERVAAARAAAEQPEATDQPDEPEEPVEDEEEEIVVPDDISELTEDKEKELVTASGKNVVARVAGNAPAVIIPAEPEAPQYGTIVAAASVPDYTPGTDLGDFGGVAEAYAARTRGFGNGPVSRGSKAIGKAKGSQALGADGNVYQLSDSAQRFGLARIEKPENEFSTGMDMSVQDQMDVMLAAAKEDRLPGGSLVAAGGWCAPSETLYRPFCSLETIDGILSIPDVHVSRGGINFTKGPDYATLAASWGFLQTEAQAEAGTAKVCYAVE